MTLSTVRGITVPPIYLRQSFSLILMQPDTNESHEHIIARLRANRFVLGIPLTVLVADILVRTQSGFNPDVIRPFESIAFLVAGIFLFTAARSDLRISIRTYKIELWLGLVFLLGSVRAGLWGAGMEIMIVNQITLGLGIAGSILMYFWSHRATVRNRDRRAG